MMLDSKGPRDLEIFEQLGIIEEVSGVYRPVVRDESWLRERGLLRYERIKLPELSKLEYRKVVEIDPIGGEEGILALLGSIRELNDNSPIRYSFTFAMGEIYNRFGRAFPDKEYIWKRTEILSYFGVEIC